MILEDIIKTTDFLGRYVVKRMLITEITPSPKAFVVKVGEYEQNLIFVFYFYRSVMPFHYQWFSDIDKVVLSALKYFPYTIIPQLFDDMTHYEYIKEKGQDIGLLKDILNAFVYIVEYQHVGNGVFISKRIR